MKKIFWGSFFILSAAFVIMNQMGYYENLSLWTILMTIFLLPILFKSLFKLEFFGVTLSSALLVIIYKGYLNIGDISSMSIILSALLLATGFTILFKRKKGYNCAVDDYDQVINVEDESNIKMNVNFSSSIKYINSDDFKTADLNCSFGAMKIYFDNAKMLGDSATVSLNISFAGVELFVPKNWKVINKIDTSLGGVDEKNSSSPTTEKTLILTGKVNLAGVEIVYI